MEKLVTFFIQNLQGIKSNEIICFIISLFPVLELRGGMLAASPLFLDVPYIKALIICIMGNLLPIPFVLLLLEKILVLFEKIPLFNQFALWIRSRADKDKEKIEAAGFFGLVFFVGIPLPGTGAWTGSLIASILHMDFKKSFLAISIGVIIAAVIMSIISYGILASFA